MVIGDIFDRGKDVPQIFWLFYKLEDEAAKAGGTVSFLLHPARISGVLFPDRPYRYVYTLIE